jgi:hypothetical protein
MIKKKIPLLLLISAYTYIAIVVLILAISKGLSIDALLSTIGLHILLVLAIYLPNLIYALRSLKSEVKALEFLFWSVVLKVLFIPIYGVIFLLGLVTSINPMTWFFTFLFIFFDYSLLLSSSVYTIVGTIKAKRAGDISRGFEVIYILMQFIFVLDVISSIWLYFKMRKLKSNDKLRLEVNN